MEAKFKKELQDKINQAATLLSEVDSTLQELIDEYPEDEEARTEEQNDEYDALGALQETIQNAQSDIEGLEVP